MYSVHKNTHVAASRSQSIGHTHLVSTNAWRPVPTFLHTYDYDPAASELYDGKPDKETSGLLECYMHSFKSQNNCVSLFKDNNKVSPSKSKNVCDNQGLKHPH